MKQRVITGVIFAALFTAFFLPAFWFPITAVIMSVVVGSFVVYELIKALKNGKYEPSTALIVCGCAISLLVLAASYCLRVSAENALAVYVMIIGMFTLACGILIPVARTNDSKALENGIATGGTVFYVTFPLFCLDAAMLLLPEGCNGWYYMLIGLVAPWISDVFAYLVGVTMGKHKIVPHISPKKTWEGCIGGAFFCAVGEAFIGFDTDVVDGDAGTEVDGIGAYHVSVASGIAKSVNVGVDAVGAGQMMHAMADFFSEERVIRGTVHSLKLSGRQQFVIKIDLLDVF